MDLPQRETTVFKFAHRQRGAAVLAGCLLILFIFALSSVFNTQLAVSEQLLTGNELRLAQATNNAHSGLAQAQSELSKPATRTTPALSSNTNVVNSDGQTQGRFSTHIQTMAPTRMKIISQGWSADSSAKKSMSLQVQQQNLIQYFPQASVTATQSIVLGENIELRNSPSTSLWAGKSIQSTLQSENIKPNDTQLAALNKNEFVRNFLGMTMNQITANFPSPNCTTQRCTTENIAVNEPITYIEGDLTIDRNLGSETQPVILLLDGSLKMEHNATIHGIVFILNDWVDTHSNGEINGALLLAGKLDLRGIVSIHYAPSIIAQLQQSATYYTAIEGTWRNEY